MQINNRQEALFVAVEMEKTAVELYERALRLMKAQGRERKPLYQELRSTLCDEKRHLKQFQALQQPLCGADEQALLLRAQAADVLFPGGLMGAARQGLLDSADAMLRFAVKSEESAAAQYRAFAESCGDEEARAALTAIAKEEDSHLSSLLLRQSAAGGRQQVK